MKKKFFKKDKQIKKSKTPKLAKKIVKAKKQARKVVIPTREEVVTLGFEQAASEPIEPDALVDLAADVVPGEPTEAV
jgi:hypothetical protein